MRILGPCDLNIPHKDWASEQEKQNYEAIEQWSYRLHDCYGLLDAPAARSGTARTRGAYHHIYFQGGFGVPSDNNGIILDFTGFSTDHVRDGVFTFDGAGNLVINTGGIAVWSGEVEMDSIPQYISGSAAFGSVTCFGAGDRRRLTGYGDTPPGIGTIFHLGGGTYQPYQWTMQVSVQQNTGYNPMPCRIYFYMGVMEAY